MKEKMKIEKHKKRYSNNVICLKYRLKSKDNNNKENINYLKKKKKKNKTKNKKQVIEHNI